jgi:hypothetical protein
VTTICLAALGCNGVFGIEDFGLKPPARGDSGAAEDAELDEDSRSPIDAGPDAGELTGITATSPPDHVIITAYFPRPDSPVWAAMQVQVAPIGGVACAI